MHVFLLIRLQIPVIMQLVKSAAPHTELPTVPHSVLHCGYCSTSTMGTASNHFRAELSIPTYVCPLSGVVFCFLTSSIVQERYNIGVEPLVLLCFVRKSHSKINQSKSISVPLTVFYRLSFSLFFSSLDLRNT